MPIISENQSVKAQVAVMPNHLDIEFADDPSFIRGETVILDLMQCSIGIIFQNGYHHIGQMPKELERCDLSQITKARLSGQGAGGRRLELSAPIKVVSKHH